MVGSFVLRVTLDHLQEKLQYKIGKYQQCCQAVIDTLTRICDKTFGIWKVRISTHGVGRFSKNIAWFSNNLYILLFLATDGFVFDVPRAYCACQSSGAYSQRVPQQSNPVAHLIELYSRPNRSSIHLTIRCT